MNLLVLLKFVYCILITDVICKSCYIANIIQYRKTASILIIDVSCESCCIQTLYKKLKFSILLNVLNI